MNYIAILLALCLCVDVEAQRRGGRPQSLRRGRQEGAEAGYAAPGGVPVYGAASDAVPVYGAAGDDALSALQGSIPGVPGEDYPIYAEVPETSFDCSDKIDGGYYADPEAECQAFHICTADAQGGLAKYSFLCPNGTILNQNYLICDWWFNFDCAEAEAIAEQINAEIAAEREAASADAGQAAYGAPVSDYSAEPVLGAYDIGADTALEGYEVADPAVNEYAVDERSGRRLGNRRNNRRGGQRFGK